MLHSDDGEPKKRRLGVFTPKRPPLDIAREDWKAKEAQLLRTFQITAGEKTTSASAAAR